MISLESQVLERHLNLFSHKTILFCGGIRDNFPQQIQNIAKEIKIWSWYFDYAKDKDAVNFNLEYKPQQELIIYYWIKNKQEANFQLMQLLSQVKLGQEFLIVGENRCGVRSVEKLLSPHGNIAKIDSARRCGLYHFSLQNPPHFNLNKFWKIKQLPQAESLSLFSLPSVFNDGEIDAGTTLLLSTLNQPISGKVLDMGCGTGAIGCYIKKCNPQAEVTLTDIHAVALASAERTLKENQLTGKVIASDVFSHIQDKFDLIVSNPPFHSGTDTAYRATYELISQAKWHLNPGGELRIVANSFLPYGEMLTQHFGSYRILDNTTKFKVYSVHY
ncbi:16S rRNA (guanine(1207)-N(2))-methyltransferase RsmC [Seminibacterium arietis]|uniref:Ribosomal RNA small subunit methyltransferase C n=1 Tax=Seminibacterium arietis TaxID=1173502 RepID=A0ABW3I612_9PAST